MVVIMDMIGIMYNVHEYYDCYLNSHCCGPVHGRECGYARGRYYGHVHGHCRGYCYGYCFIVLARFITTAVTVIMVIMMMTMMVSMTDDDHDVLGALSLLWSLFVSLCWSLSCLSVPVG
jgi:hypothetical protein